MEKHNILLSGKGIYIVKHLGPEENLNCFELLEKFNRSN